jgi:hypothetical protein
MSKLIIKIFDWFRAAVFGLLFILITIFILSMSLGIEWLWFAFTHWLFG